MATTLPRKAFPKAFPASVALAREVTAFLVAWKAENGGKFRPQPAVIDIVVGPDFPRLPVVPDAIVRDPKRRAAETPRGIFLPASAYDGKCSVENVRLWIKNNLRDWLQVLPENAADAIGVTVTDDEREGVMIYRKA